MKEAAKYNAALSLVCDALELHDLAGFYFRQAWALCPRTTLDVRRGKKAN